MVCASVGVPLGSKAIAAVFQFENWVNFAFTSLEDVTKLEMTLNNVYLRDIAMIPELSDRPRLKGSFQRFSIRCNPGQMALSKGVQRIQLSPDFSLQFHEASETFQAGKCELWSSWLLCRLLPTVLIPSRGCNDGISSWGGVV